VSYFKAASTLIFIDPWHDSSRSVGDKRKHYQQIFSGFNDVPASNRKTGGTLKPPNATGKLGLPHLGRIFRVETNIPSFVSMLHYEGNLSW